MTIWSTGLRLSIQWTALCGLALVLPGCGFFVPSEAQVGRPERDPDQPVAVETARAQLGTVTEALEYTGTTRPQQQVALRAQPAGEVDSL